MAEPLAHLRLAAVQARALDLALLDDEKRPALVPLLDNGLPRLERDRLERVGEAQQVKVGEALKDFNLLEEPRVGADDDDTAVFRELPAGLVLAAGPFPSSMFPVLVARCGGPGSLPSSRFLGLGFPPLSLALGSLRFPALVAPVVVMVAAPPRSVEVPRLVRPLWWSWWLPCPFGSSRFHPLTLLDVTLE